MLNQISVNENSPCLFKLYSFALHTAEQISPMLPPGSSQMNSGIPCHLRSLNPSQPYPCDLPVPVPMPLSPCAQLGSHFCPLSTSRHEAFPYYLPSPIKEMRINLFVEKPHLNCQWTARSLQAERRATQALNQELGWLSLSKGMGKLPTWQSHTLTH